MPSDPETIREEGVNVLLAQMLRDRGVSARAERRTRQGIPDIRVQLGSGGDLVLVECKWQDSAGLLEDQLEDRLKGFPEALGIIGLLYPGRLRYEEDTRSGLENAEDLRWWLGGSRGVARPERRIRTGSVADLADQIRALPLELEGVDRVVAAAAVVGYALEQAATQVAGHARISRRIADIIASTDQEKNRLPGALQTAPPLSASAAWCSSMLSHSRTVSPRMKMFRLSTKPWDGVPPVSAALGALSATTSTTYPSSSWPPTSLTCSSMGRTKCRLRLSRPC